MAECKAALQVLLNMAVAAKLIIATAEKSKEDVEQQCHELRTREQSLAQKHQAEISRISRGHDEFVTSLKEQHEEKVQYLLQQIPSHDDSHEETKQQLKEQIAALQQENHNLNEQLKKLTDFFETESPSPQPKKQVKKPSKSKETVEVMDEDWDELMSDGSEAEDSVDRDPDWVQTPRVPQRRSGRRTNSIETTSLSMIKSSGVCGCSGKCATNNCPCRKKSSDCSADCGCKASKCVNRNQKPLSGSKNVITISESEGVLEPSHNLKTEPVHDRKVLNEVKNTCIPSQGLKNPAKIKRTNSSMLKSNGSENKRPKLVPKPQSSSSVSSDEDSTQSRSRPGTTPGRRTPVRGTSKTPGFSFGSGRKVVVKKPVTKFNPENKKKRKLLKPVNTASSLGLKVL